MKKLFILAFTICSIANAQSNENRVFIKSKEDRSTELEVCLKQISDISLENNIRNYPNDSLMASIQFETVLWGQVFLMVKSMDSQALDQIKNLECVSEVVNRDNLPGPLPGVGRSN
jgi:hypothetical protein